MHRRCARFFALFCAAVLFASCDEKSPFEPDDDLSLAALNGGTLRLNAGAASQDRIDLSWQDASTNETGYELQRSTTGANGSFTLLANLPSNLTSYSDRALTAATEYCYRVRAYRITGKKTTYSTFSNTACAKTQDTPAPPPPPPGPVAPSALNARPAGSLVHTAQITWTDNSADESGFRVQRASSPDGPWALATTAGSNATSHIDYGQPMEQQLCYRVVAFYTAGGESSSNVDCTYLPATPSDLTVAGQSAANVDLAWTDNSAYEDGYDVERLEDGVWTYTTVGHVDANVATFRDATISANGTYTYRVWVTREGARAGVSNTVTTVIATEVPAAPGWLTVVPDGSRSIVVNWENASTNETGFRVERSDNGGATWEIAGSRTANDAGFYDVGRTPEQRTCYRAFAFNSVGDSPSSPVGCTVPPAGPTNLVARTATSSPTTGFAIDLTWTDNSAVEDGYDIRLRFEYCYFGCSEYYETIASVGANVTSYRDAGLSPGYYRTYTVVARANGGLSDPSNPATALSGSPPNAPSNLTATAVSRTQIDLVWTDNSLDEENFFVERCVGTQADCGDTGFSGLGWASGPNATSFSDRSAQPNTTYTYRVFSYRSDVFLPSNTASATTPP